MSYDNDENWHSQFHVKIIVGILEKIWLFSHGLETETRILMLKYVANFELFKRYLQSPYEEMFFCLVRKL